MPNYVYKGDYEIEILVQSSKNGTIGQNARHSFWLARIVFAGQTNHKETMYAIPIAFFQNLLFLEIFVY